MWALVEFGKTRAHRENSIKILTLQVNFVRQHSRHKCIVMLLNPKHHYAIYVEIMIAAFAANEHWTNQLNTHWENRKNKLNKYYAAYKYNAGKYRTGLEREKRGCCHVEKKKSALCATIHLISRIMANCSKSWKIRVSRIKTRRKRKKPAKYRLFLWYTIRGSNPGHPD